MKNLWSERAWNEALRFTWTIRCWTMQWTERQCWKTISHWRTNGTWHKVTMDNGISNSVQKALVDELLLLTAEFYRGWYYSHLWVDTTDHRVMVQKKIPPTAESWYRRRYYLQLSHGTDDDTTISRVIVQTTILLKAESWYRRRYYLQLSHRTDDDTTYSRVIVQTTILLTVELWYRRLTVESWYRQRSYLKPSHGTDDDTT